MSTEALELETDKIERTEEDRRKKSPVSPGEGDRRIATADRRHGMNRQYATFYLQNHYLGVELEKVQEVFTARTLTRVPLAPPAVTGLINLRGHIIMSIDLRKRIGFEDRSPEEEVMSIIVRTDDGSINLLVDRIGDVIEVRPDLFEPPPATLDPKLRSTVEGVYKLKDQLLLALSTEVVTQIDKQ